MTNIHTLPTIEIYLLGHNVGNIEEPVIYVRDHCYDSNGNIVTKGFPNAFVDSLNHESIIVQIPRLKGQIITRFDKVLSIFNQSNKYYRDNRLINYQEQNYDGDEDMELIFYRLAMAAANQEIMEQIQIEAEFISVIEKRDTRILIQDKQLSLQEKLLVRNNELSK